MSRVSSFTASHGTVAIPLASVTIWTSPTGRAADRSNRHQHRDINGLLGHSGGDRWRGGRQQLLRLQDNTMDLGGFSLAWLRDLAFCAALEAERDSWQALSVEFRAHQGVPGAI
jgi:hypothetical protein